jgi:signal transduction histidine kinase
VLGRAALVLLPALAAVLVAASELFGSAGGLSLGCPVLPNRVVPLSARLHAACPLRAFDRVEQIEIRGLARWVDGPETLREALADAPSAVLVRVRGASGPAWVRVPVVDPRREAPARLAAAAVLATSVLTTVLLVTLRAPALAPVLPFSLLYAAICGFLLCAVTLSSSRSLVLVLIASSALVPAALVHLALTFPRPTLALRRHPQLAWAVYGFALLFVLLAAASFGRFPAAWIFVEQLLASSTLAALAMLALRCLAALADERARGPARAFLVGLGLVLAVPALLALAGEGAPVEGPLVMLTWATALSPVPFGYGIARHHLFGIDLHLRRAVAHLLHVSLLAGIVFLSAFGARLFLGAEMPFEDPTVLFAAMLVLVAAGDGLGARLRRSIFGWIDPEASRWQRLATHHGARLARLRDADACAQIGAEAIAEGLEPRGVSVFVEEGGEPTLAYSVGQRAPRSAAAARAASAALGDESALLVAELAARGAADPELSRAGVEAVAALRGPEGLLGVALVAGSARGVAFSQRHLAFLASVARSTALAIENARLAHELAVSRRFAAIGRLRAELAHEIGKPLGSLEFLARTLPERLSDPLRASRDARVISDIAARLRAIVREVLASAHAPGAERGAAAAVRVADLVDGAIEEMAWAHGPDRVARRIAPNLPVLAPGAARLLRALVNLLDNALRASPPHEVVELSARARRGGVEIEIVDRGCGMSEQAQRRAFEPFVSAREPGAGSGLGLGLVREVVTGLGGRIEVRSAQGTGTRVAVWIPALQPHDRIAF